MSKFSWKEDVNKRKDSKFPKTDLNDLSSEAEKEDKDNSPRGTYNISKMKSKIKRKMEKFRRA